MYQRLNLLSCIAFCLLLACNKDALIVKPSTGSNVSQSTSPKLDTSRGWYGTYRYFFEDPEDTTEQYLLDKDIIANGEATVPNMQDVDEASINYDMPAKEIIHGDSTTFKMGLKKKGNTLDVYLVGTKNTMHLYYYTYNDTGFYTLQLGAIYKTVKLFPATDFTNFRLVQFQCKRNKAYLYVGDKLVTSFNYGGKNKMGNVKQISIGNQSYIECNYVRLYNSSNQKLEMREEFNIDGESHTIFNP
jgi:hypothetical protein